MKKPNFSYMTQIEKKSTDKILRYVTYIEELHFLQSLNFTHEFLQSVYDIEQMYNFPGEILVLCFISSCIRKKINRHDFFFFAYVALRNVH